MSTKEILAIIFITSILATIIISYLVSQDKKDRTIKYKIRRS